MSVLSPRQREIQAQEEKIITSARKILLSEGYYGLTMDRIAQAADCPKGTLYLRFASKEDIIIALALNSFERRLEMMRRGAAYAGRTRERMVAIGEGVALFARLSPDDSRILHTAGGPVREKANPDRVAAMRLVENQTVAFILTIVQEAIQDGDLDLPVAVPPGRVAYGMAAMVDGGYAMMENAVPQEALGLEHPVREIYWIFNKLADAYGWRPLFHEQDWDATLADIRKTMFFDEAQELYGEGNWQGDAGFF